MFVFYSLVMDVLRIAWEENGKLHCEFYDDVKHVWIPSTFGTWSSIETLKSSIKLGENFIIIHDDNEE